MENDKPPPDGSDSDPYKTIPPELGAPRAVSRQAVAGPARIGRYRIERLLGKGGFTSLLAAFGAVLKPSSPDSIRRAFARVSVKQMRAWVSQNLKTTLASRRQTAYSEFAGSKNIETHAA